MHSKSYSLCIARYFSYMNVHFQQLHTATAEIILSHGNISYFFFLVKKKKPKKPQNKPTSKQKTKHRFGCKIFGNSLTFLTECFCVHSKVSSKTPKLLLEGNLDSKFTDRHSIDSFMYELSYYPLSLGQADIWHHKHHREGTGLVSGQKKNLGFPSWRFTWESAINFPSTWKILDSVRDKGGKCSGHL